MGDTSHDIRQPKAALRGLLTQQTQKNDSEKSFSSNDFALIFQFPLHRLTSRLPQREQQLPPVLCLIHIFRLQLTPHPHPRPRPCAAEVLQRMLQRCRLCRCSISLHLLSHVIFKIGLCDAAVSQASLCSSLKSTQKTTASQSWSRQEALLLLTSTHSRC